MLPTLTLDLAEPPRTTDADVLPFNRARLGGGADAAAGARRLAVLREGRAAALPKREGAALYMPDDPRITR